MSSSTQAPLAPTLWRTCRALANRRRLILLRYLIQHPYRQVSEVATALQMPLALTSQYLRSLNARGLLKPVRSGLCVFYQAAPDPLVPPARTILTAMAISYTKTGEKVDSLFSALTGFTHPRRILLMRALARGAKTTGLLASRTGISRRAVRRHMDKLLRRGYVTRKGDAYQVCRVRSGLKATLLKLALQSS
ncbi:MAG: winged helix-turn-helix transcriptional regulator [Kiritimatiellae bacterium]|nr:winged helix-turn-helix transcriptional regulator [Kiritimatiellia bacterium]